MYQQMILARTDVPGTWLNLEEIWVWTACVEDVDTVLQCLTKELHLVITIEASGWKLRARTHELMICAMSCR